MRIGVLIRGDLEQLDWAHRLGFRAVDWMRFEKSRCAADDWKPFAEEFAVRAKQLNLRISAIGALYRNPLDPQLSVLSGHYAVDDSQTDKGGDNQHGGTDESRPMPTHGAKSAIRPGLAIDTDRFVGQPTIDVVGQLLGRGIPLGLVARHRFQAYRLQRARDLGLDFAGRGKVAAPNLGQHLLSFGFREGSLIGQQAVEGRS